MDDLLLKYIEEKATPSEIRTVEDWITLSAENQEHYNNLKAKYLADTFGLTSSSIDVEKELSAFKASLKEQNSGNVNPEIRISLKYAAAIILLVGLSGWLYLMVRNDILDAIPANAITLQMEDGTVKVIPEDRQEVIRGKDGEVIGEQIQNRLVYKNGKADENPEISYNILKVPYGKRFDIVLSDGSRIFLNSGTSIRYPVNFPEEGNREVIIRGEAFFEVEKDAARPFIVNANGVNIRVLGTKFNVSAYEEEDAVHTVLVEGAVGLYEGEDYGHSEKTLLAPGHKATWNKLNHDIEVEETEISVYTSWLKGEIVFKHMKLKSILKTLERQYDVEIVKPEDDIGNMRFTASFHEEQSITQILETFKKHYGMDYRMDDGKIIIDKP